MPTAATVRFVRGELPAAWPDLPVDLVVLSEVLYFLSAGEIASLARRVAATWLPHGDAVLVNYLGPTSEALEGAEAADLFIAALEQGHAVSRVRNGRYQIDVLTRSA